MGKKRLAIFVLMALALSASMAFAIPFGYVLNEHNNLVLNQGDVNSPFCTNARGLTACKTCLGASGVDCAMAGQAGCSDGKGYKGDTLLTFTPITMPLSGRLFFIGGENVYCDLNGNRILEFYTRNNCGAFTGWAVPASVFTMDNNILACAVAGSGDDQDNGFKLSFFSYQLSSQNKVGNVLVQDAENPVGTLRELLKDSEFINVPNWSASVQSQTPNVMVWVGDESSYTRKESSNPDDYVYACADTNQNSICDGNEGPAVICASAGGDWYNGKCCGTDYTTCQYVSTTANVIYVVRDRSQNIISIRTTPTSGYASTPGKPMYVIRDYTGRIIYLRTSQVSGYQELAADTIYVRETTAAFGETTLLVQETPAAGYTPIVLATGLNAFCGKRADGKWEWASLDAQGEIHEFFGCSGWGSIVSDGTTFYACGGTQPANTVAFGQFRSVMINGFMHEYICQDDKLEECGGASPFSRTNALATGEKKTVQQQTYYCASDGDWTVDLDNKDKESCEAAGYAATGWYCCSEDDDVNEYYNDPGYPAALGGCWNKGVIRSGEFAVADSVINYRGQFYGCRITDADPLLELKDTHTANYLIDNSVEPCGYVLEDAQFGTTFPHAVCQPNGVWKFTNEVVGTVYTSIAWTPPSMTGIAQSGCCKEDQCWNGTKCQALGSYYRIGDQGFVCKR